MTYAAGQAEPDASPILHAAIGLAPRIRAAAEEIEQSRHLPKPVVDGLKDAGVF